MSQSAVRLRLPLITAKKTRPSGGGIAWNLCSVVTQSPHRLRPHAPSSTCNLQGRRLVYAANSPRSNRYVCRIRPAQPSVPSTLAPKPSTAGTLALSSELARI
ncbi:hypothetical protein BS78_06G153200 [Paspalum vaginatum]|nr:hypothetical protein BS78_06G153200 [Paspalum vaginatum]